MPASAVARRLSLRARTGLGSTREETKEAAHGDDRGAQPRAGARHCGTDPTWRAAPTGCGSSRRRRSRHSRPPPPAWPRSDIDLAAIGPERSRRPRARRPGGRDPRRRAARARLHPDAWRAGGSLVAPAGRDRLFRPRRAAGRAGVAERDGPHPGPREGHRRRLRAARRIAATRPRRACPTTATPRTSSGCSA